MLFRFRTPLTASETIILILILIKIVCLYVCFVYVQNRKTEDYGKTNKRDFYFKQTKNQTGKRKEFSFSSIFPVSTKKKKKKKTKKQPEMWRIAKAKGGGRLYRRTEPRI